jgi:hypothetical protein
MSGWSWPPHIAGSSCSFLASRPSWEADTSPATGDMKPAVRGAKQGTLEVNDESCVGRQQSIARRKQTATATVATAALHLECSFIARSQLPKDARQETQPCRHIRMGAWQGLGRRQVLQPAKQTSQQATKETNYSALYKHHSKQPRRPNTVPSTNITASSLGGQLQFLLQ